MNLRQSRQWIHDFEAFAQEEALQVPSELDRQLWQRLKPLVEPNPGAVFRKLFAIHLIVGFFSLAICHQFEVNPFGTSKSLANVFEEIGGHNFCMLACGVFFVALPMLAAGFFLSIEEIKALRRTEFAQTFTLGLISLGIFAIFGAELAMSMAGLWLLGVLIGGFISSETVWQFRKISN